MKLETNETQSVETTITELSEKDLIKQFALHSLEPEKYPLSEVEVTKAKTLMDKRYAARQILNEFDAKQQLDALLEANHSYELATHSSQCVNPTNPLEKMLVDQTSALHVAGMTLLSQLSSDIELGLELYNKITNISTKLFKTSHEAMQTLHQVRNGGKQVITVKHQNVQVNGGQAVIADIIQSNARGGEDEN